MAWTEYQLCRVIIYLAEKLEARKPLDQTALAEDVADCIEWAHERVQADAEEG